MTEPAAAPAAPDTPRGALTIQQAVAHLDAQDAAAKATPAPKAAPEPPAADASTDTAEQAPEDEAGEVEQAEAASEEPEQPETEQEAEPEGNDDETLVALPDGKEVPLAELVKGYFRQADYTRKTQALAEERKTFDAAKKQHADTVRQVEQALSARVTELEAAAKARDRYNQMADLVKAKLDEEHSNRWSKADWRGMLQNIRSLVAQGLDYEASKAQTEYNQNWAEYQLHLQAQQAVAAEKAKTQAERDAEEAKRRDEQQAQLVQLRQQAEARAKEHLLTKYPDLADKAKAPKLVGDLFEAARHFGYSEEEAQQTLDPRGIDMWWAATQWLKSQAAAKNVTQQKGAEPSKPAPSGVRIIKGNAPRPRALTVERGRLGGTEAAFNANPSFETALARLNAREEYRSKRR